MSTQVRLISQSLEPMGGARVPQHPPPHYFAKLDVTKRHIASGWGHPNTFSYKKNNLILLKKIEILLVKNVFGRQEFFSFK